MRNCGESNFDNIPTDFQVFPSLEVVCRSSEPRTESNFIGDRILKRLCQLTDQRVLGTMVESKYSLSNSLHGDKFAIELNGRSSV